MCPTTVRSRWSRFFDHPYALRLQRRRVRRPLAVALVAAVGLHPLATLVLGVSAPSTVFALLFLVLVLATGVSIRGLTDIRDRALDERQLMLKERAFRLSFFPGVLTALGAGLFHRPAMDLDPSLGFVHTALMVSLAVVWPAIVLAWTLPDEDLDGEDG